MAQKLTKVRIFIATPNDLVEERGRVARVVQGLDKTGGLAEGLGLTLELLGYETHARPDVGRPQEVILRQLSPERWDIFVGALWTHFGTRTGAADPETGHAYQSGTEEEFRAAWHQRRESKTGRPRIMFYRCMRPAPLEELDAAQYAHVQEFFRQFAADGGHPGLVSTYAEPEEFERLVRDHLEDTLREYARELAAEEPRPPAAARAGGGLPAGAEPQPESAFEVTVPPGPLRYVLDRFCPRLHTFLSTRIQFFKLPAEWRTLNGYLTTLRSDIADDIREKTYVEPQAKAAPDEVNRLHPQRTGFLTPIQQVIKEIVGVSHGGDAHSAQISAISRKSRFVGNLVERLMEADEPLILLGDPGTGKSITLQQAAMLIAERESRRVFPNVCLFVRLGEFRADGPITEQSVWDYVKRSAPPRLRPYLDSLDYLGRLVIFFDGMDEMSRQRYNEYTRALSVFADSRKMRHTKTLFSCRITDFTPRFQHRRLVLLPFSRAHIHKYITRQLSFPIRVGGRPWTARQLANHLAYGELPMQADNPFVLWLLCTYLRQRREWPGSRVDLLGYYNLFNYERKARDAESRGARLPNMESAFLALGRVAYEITERNRGAAVPREEVEALLGPGGAEEVQAGVQCGVLQTSLDTETALIRFEHHRFQEYFTARHLERHPTARAALNWLDKLDAPRWQETLFNLVLMGGGEEALAALREAIEREHARLAAETDAHTRNQREETSTSRRIRKAERRVSTYRRPPTQEPKAAPRAVGIKDAAAETLLADRVELASRVLQQTGQRGEGAVADLYATFRTAAYWLADHGNPITKVKMLLGSKAVPGIDIFRVAREALTSDVAWVRQQALIVTSVVRRDVGEDALQEDLSHNFASGRFPKRISGYVRIASALRQRRVWLALAAGLVLTIAQFLAGYGFMLGVYRAVPPGIHALTMAEISRVEEAYANSFIPADETGNEKKHKELNRRYREIIATRSQWLEATSSARGWLDSRWFFLFFSVAYLLTFVYTMRRLPGQQDLTALSSGLTLFFLTYIGWMLWLGHWPQLFVLIVLVFLAAPPLFFAGWALALFVHALTLVPFTAAAAQRKGFAPRLRTMFEATWENCGFRTWVSSRPVLAWTTFSTYVSLLLLFVTYLDALAALVSAYGLFHRFPLVLDAILSVATAYAVLVLLPLALLSALARGRPGWRSTLNRFVVRSALVCLVVPCVAFMLWGLFFVDWERVWEFALAAGLFPSFPSAANVALSGIIYANVLGAALSFTLRLGSRGRLSGWGTYKVLTAVCLVAAAFVLLVWWVNSVNWGVVWAFIASTFGLLGALPPPLNAAFSVAICAEVAGILGSVGYLRRGRAGWAGMLRFIRNWTLFCLCFAAGCFLLWVIYLNSDYFARILAVVIFIFLVALPLLFLGGLAKELAPVIEMLRGPIGRNRYSSTAAWKKTLADYDPEYQAALLQRTTPETLGLFVEDFLALLQSVEGVIKKDPAQSAYWAKRQQIEQIIRQERIG